MFQWLIPFNWLFIQVITLKEIFVIELCSCKSRITDIVNSTYFLRKRCCGRTSQIYGSMLTCWPPYILKKLIPFPTKVFTCNKPYMFVYHTPKLVICFTFYLIPINSSVEFKQQYYFVHHRLCFLSNSTECRDLETFLLRIFQRQTNLACKINISYFCLLSI